MNKIKNDMLIEEIYRRYLNPVKYYVLSMCGNETVAEDITAETFLKALKNIEKFKSGNIFTWLCTIAKNTYFDYASKKERSAVPLTDEMLQAVTDSSPSPESEAVTRDEKLALYRALHHLAPEEREIVYLKMFTELTFKEIGAILGTSENRARVVFYRSKNKLKGLISNEN